MQELMAYQPRIAVCGIKVFAESTNRTSLPSGKLVKLVDMPSALKYSLEPCEILPGI